MKIMNYMNLNQHPVQLSFYKDRSQEFVEIYHAHQGMECLYIHKGNGTAVVEQQIFEVTAGTFIVLKPFQLHRLRMSTDQGQCYLRSLFVFEPAVLEAALTPFTSLRAFFQALWKDTLSAQVFCGLPAEEIDNLFQPYMARLEHMEPELLLEEQLLFLTALMHRIKSLQTKDEKSAKHFTKINQASTAEKIMAWIEVHYMEPFELEKLAKTVHLSPNHVSTTFRQSVGSSISEYLAARRIRQACWLLRTSPLSVQEIGREIGLSNFSYFCQMFKKHVGLTPYQFKSSPFDPANGV